MNTFILPKFTQKTLTALTLTALNVALMSTPQLAYSSALTHCDDALTGSPSKCPRVSQPGDSDSSDESKTPCNLLAELPAELVQDHILPLLDPESKRALRATCKLHCDDVDAKLQLASKRASNGEPMITEETFKTLLRICSHVKENSQEAFGRLRRPLNRFAEFNFDDIEVYEAFIDEIYNPLQQFDKDHKDDLFSLKNHSFTVTVGQYDNFKTLMEVLPNSPISTLRLISNKIGEDGETALAEALKGSNVTTLELWGAKIGDDGATALAKVLKDSNVTNLVLWNNQIGGYGAIALAKALEGSNVTNLELWNNEIGDAGATALAEALKGSNVTNLNLGWNGISNSVKNNLRVLAQKLDINILL